MVPGDGVQPISTLIGFGFGDTMTLFDEDGGEHVFPMPGRLTDEQCERLKRGEDVDDVCPESSDETK
jgi:hypothetical protein